MSELLKNLLEQFVETKTKWTPLTQIHMTAHFPDPSNTH
jgi:hypothetical protein